jgi:acetylornithine deacetylase
MTQDAVPSISAALALAARDVDRSVRRLRDLVQIRSLTGEEGPAQDFVVQTLEEIGAEISIAEPDLPALFDAFPHIAQYPTHWQHDLILPYTQLTSWAALRDSGLESVLNYRGRPNVVGVLTGSGGGRSLILNGHVDTVTVEPAAEWIRDPFGGEIDGNRLFGRGSSDMKGGLMAALMALSFLRESGVQLRGDVVFQSVVNEEHAGNGTLDLVRRGFRADGAIVLEPTHNRVAVTHTGGLYWQVTVPGIARSPGARWDGETLVGVSAIEKLPVPISALLALEKAFNDSPSLLRDEGQAPFALVIGKVAAGHYETVTAGQAVLRGGAYFSPKAGDILDVMQSFRNCIAEANAREPFFRENPMQLEFLHHDDGTDQPASIAIAQHACATLRSRGGDPAIRPGPFACDMRHLVNQGGIPSIIFGPGSIAQAHRPDEFIELSEYTACIEHLIAIIATWCNAPPLRRSLPVRRLRSG